MLTIIACITSVWSGMETASTVAGPFIMAIMFLVHNFHVRKSHQEVSDALAEVRAARSEVTSTREDLSANTDRTEEAIVHAERAAASAARTEKLVAQIHDMLAHKAQD